MLKYFIFKTPNIYLYQKYYIVLQVCLKQDIPILRTNSMILYTWSVGGLSPPLS